MFVVIAGPFDGVTIVVSYHNFLPVVTTNNHINSINHFGYANEPTIH